MTMAGPQPLALQLEQLLNPRPREADPEADPEEGEADWNKATCRAVGPAPCGPGPRARAGVLTLLRRKTASRSVAPGIGGRLRLLTRALNLGLGWAEHPAD